MRRAPAGRDSADGAPFWRPGAVPALLQAVLVTTTGVLPAFLVGALTVQIRDDLSLGPAQMGVAAATLFTVVCSVPLLFGLVVEATSDRTGWFVAAGTALAAAILFRVGRHMIRSSRRLPTGRGSIIRDKERT